MRAPSFILALLTLVACGGGVGSPPPPSRPGPDPSPPTETMPSTEVRVIDADTVDVDGLRWRSHEIDAPEARQSCRAWGPDLDGTAGAAAMEALRSRATGTICEGGETDRYGRSIGMYSLGGKDLNAWLVANGCALAYQQYADDYADEVRWILCGTVLEIGAQKMKTSAHDRPGLESVRRSDYYCSAPIAPTM